MIAAIVAVIYCVSPAVLVGDSRMSLPTAVSIYRSGDLTLDEFAAVGSLRNEYDVLERDGRLVMAYPWPPALFLVPVAALADLIPGVDPGTVSISNPNRTWPYEVPIAALLMAGAAALFFRAARAAGSSSRAAVLATLALAFGTVWWSSVSRSLSQHAAAAPFIVLVLYLMTRSRHDERFIAWLGAAVAGAYVMRPTTALLVAIVSTWVLWKHPRRFVPYLARAALVAVPFVIVNLVVYASILPPYYRSTDSFSSAVEPLTALAGLLVSPSRGLLWYSPLVLVGIAGFVTRARRRDLDSVDAVFGLFVIGSFALAAAWPNWWGGSTFGPRLLAEIMPFFCWYLLPVIERVTRESNDRVAPTDPSPERFAAGRRRATLVLYALIGVSVLVNAQGALFRSTVCWNSVPVFVDIDSRRVWDWGDPQPLRPIRDLASGASVRQVVAGSCKDAGGQPINGG